MSMTGALHVFSVDVLPHPASSLITRCLSHQRSRTLTRPIRPGALTHTVFPVVGCGRCTPLYDLLDVASPALLRASTRHLTSVASCYHPVTSPAVLRDLRPAPLGMPPLQILGLAWCSRPLMRDSSTRCE